MCEGSGARKPLREEQGPVYRLRLGNLFNASIFVKEPLDGVDHVFADGLQQEMSRFAKSE